MAGLGWQAADTMSSGMTCCQDGLSYVVGLTVSVGVKYLYWNSVFRYSGGGMRIGCLRDMGRWHHLVTLSRQPGSASVYIACLSIDPVEWEAPHEYAAYSRSHRFQRLC
jgi:hypothetical protein